MPLPETIARLREGIRTASRVSGGSVEMVGVRLRLGSVHEWFGAADLGDAGLRRRPQPPREQQRQPRQQQQQHQQQQPQPQQHPQPWQPPLCVLTDVARRALAQRIVVRVFWIGARTWPHAMLFDQHPELLRRSVLVDPPDRSSRLWAIDVALRTSVPVAVVADAEGLTLAHTRRLQLAAAGSGLCLLARPPWELDLLSAATTRWGITPSPSSTLRPRWNLALLRSKDQPVLMEEPRCWIVEWNHAQNLVCVPAGLANRTGFPAAQAS